MSANGPHTTAVIVTFNSWGTIGETLDALYLAFQRGCIDCIVVDNASNDGTADFILDHYPWVKIIRSSKNLGFGRGCNLGFLEVRTPYMLILNPDAVVELSTLNTLVDFMKAKRNAAIAAPAIIEGGKQFQAAGLMTTPGSVLRSEIGIPFAMPHRKVITPGSPPFRTNWVCGAIMLVSSAFFKKLGGFDPRFFLYFEETDLCRRISYYGAEIWAVGWAVARHVGGASAKATGQSLYSSCIAEHYYRSRFYYLVKHFGWLRAVGTECILRAVLFARSIKQLLFGRRKFSSRFAEFPPFLRFPEKPDPTR
jgi:GT2 family glycosyltransferase